MGPLYAWRWGYFQGCGYVQERMASEYGERENARTGAVLHSPDRVLFRGFRFFLWTAYTDHLRVEGTRRAIAYAWMAHVMNILRNDPEAKREDYNWVLAAAPSGEGRDYDPTTDAKSNQ